MKILDFLFTDIVLNEATEEYAQGTGVLKQNVGSQNLGTSHFFEVSWTEAMLKLYNSDTGDLIQSVPLTLSIGT